MYDYKEIWKDKIAEAVNALLKENGIDGNITPAQVTAESPPNPEMGDIGLPMFGFSKMLRKGPPQIAQMVKERVGCRDQGADRIEAQGPYLNIFLDRVYEAKKILKSLISDDGRLLPTPRSLLPNKKIMVEFSSPNTNKPLHLGHLRNDVLGESISRILAACGAEVKKVCIINDRGIHICKSMLAYMDFGEGKTPESENMKSDHFVGHWYVCFNNALKAELDELIAKGVKKEEAEAKSSLMQRARELLLKWEAGDPETVELWKKMNAWTIEGMKKTYERTGVSFDKYYFESDTWMLGKDEVLSGVEKGIFFRQEDGSTAVDLTDEKLDKKILLRSDGTSIYVTQDLGTAVSRHNDWPFDRMIYVVGNEQQYHFKVLFLLLQKLGYSWAKDLYHLSYGMVNLPEGKMKSREGTIVDADDLIDNLRDMALAEIKEKNREEEVGNPADVAENIALGALHYFLLQVSPLKDMLFDPKESLSFNGNTGPYLQYMGARISSMLRKDGSHGCVVCGQTKAQRDDADFSLLVSDSEWELIKILSNYPQAVKEAASNLDPSQLAGYLYELSKSFSRFYHECPVLNAENKDLRSARLELCRAVLLVLKDAFNLICIPFLEVM